MLRANAQRMLKLDIEYVQPLFKGARDFALGVVKIGLDLHAVASGELPGPASHQVSARDPDSGSRRLIDRAVVGVALQRECAGRRSPISPKARLAADHLDPVDVFEQRVLRVPKDAREQRRVDSAPVDKDEELVCDRTGLIEAARADRILTGVDSGHLEIWRESERLGDTSGSRAANIVPGDDKDGSGRVRQALGATRYRGDLEIG